MPRETFAPGSCVEVRLTDPRGRRGRWVHGHVEEYDADMGVYTVRTSQPGTITTDRRGVRAARRRCASKTIDVVHVGGRAAYRTVAVARALADGTLVAVPKPRKPLRVPDYLAFVRRHPCASCGAAAPSEASHHGPRGVSQKADDLRVIPLCRVCHGLHHAGGFLPGAVRDYERAVQVGPPSREALAFERYWIAAVQRDLLVEWYTEGA